MPTAQPLRTGDPRTLGPYELSGRLGEGGQGVVYLGALAGESYAVKLLHGPVGDGRGAFLREVELAKHVARFCTAQVVDAGFDEGRPYIVSEYVDGPSLAREVMLTGPRRGGVLERLAVGTATAIAAIHRAGIVHRDFKPQNVLLGPDGPRVIDFGLARALDAAATLTNRSVGTPAYMAPEQITASAVTGAADVFSWGATMCFAANGTAPFGQDSVAPVLHRILTAPPDLGSLDGRLRSLVEACLDKEARNRPTSRDLLLELLGTSEGLPAEVLRSPPPHILRPVPPPTGPTPLAEPEHTGTPDAYHLAPPPGAGWGTAPERRESPSEVHSDAGVAWRAGVRSAAEGPEASDGKPAPGTGEGEDRRRRWGAGQEGTGTAAGAGRGEDVSSAFGALGVADDGAAPGGRAYGTAEGSGASGGPGALEVSRAAEVVRGGTSEAHGVAGVGGDAGTAGATGAAVDGADAAGSVGVAREEGGVGGSAFGVAGAGGGARPRIGGAAYRGSPAGYPVERVPREVAPSERALHEVAPERAVREVAPPERAVRIPAPHKPVSRVPDSYERVGITPPGAYAAELPERRRDSRRALGRAGLAAGGALLVTGAVLVTLFVPLFREDGAQVRAVTPTSSPTAEPSGQAAKDRPPTRQRVRDERAPASKEPSVRKPVQIAVPTLTGLSRAAAVRALERVGLTAGDVTKVDSPRKIGQVLASRPAVGVHVAKGTAVALEVSAGVRVPAVAGMRRKAAESAVTGAGLKVGEVSTTCSAKPEGQVLSTAPKAGARVSGGTAVSLVVARNGAPVPGVVGQSRDGALAALRAAGLVPVVQTQVVEDESQWNVALAQTPPPDTCAVPGSRVTITVGAKPPDGPDPTEPTPTPTVTPDPSTEP